MKKKNIKSLVFSLITILIIGIIITGSTYAYFQWTTGDTQKTNVNVTIEHGGITMHIEPEKTEFVGLYPTNNCENKSMYGDALVTVVNNTGTLAIPSFKLKVRVQKGGSDALTTSALSHINYSVIPITTTVDSNGKPVKGTIGSYSCKNTPIIYDSPGDGFFDNDADYSVNSTRLLFESVASDGSWTHIPKCGDITFLDDGSSLDGADCGYLPRQYYPLESAVAYKGETSGITFRANPYTTTYQYFRVYVWIDNGYKTTTIGNVISDPLQNATIYVTWSEESMVQQVAGDNEIDYPEDP